jgi:protein TonB
MSYLNQAQDPRRRAAALTGTLVIQVALGFAVVSGLTMAGYGPSREYKPIVDFPIDKPPPPDPMPDPAPQQQSTVITAPKPPLDLDRDDPPVVVRDDPPSPYVVRDPDPPIARPDPPRPVASFLPRLARPNNDPHRWITTDDYEPNWLRRELEGTAGYRVIVGTNGRVSSCEIVRPSGEGPLDTATCRYITQRARFESATDDTGAKIVGTYTGTVRWEIPD